MNKIYNLFAATLLCLVYWGCDRDAAYDRDIVRINVGLQQDVGWTKVSMKPGENNLALAWEDGDEIRIIGSARSSVFKIVSGFSEHQASFEGVEVGDGPYTVIYPGQYTSISELDAKDCAVQIQASNGDTGHLEYNAVLSGVRNAGSFSFSSGWASAENVDFLQNAVLNVIADLPSGIGEVDYAVLRANSEIFPAVNSGSTKTDSISLSLTNGIILHDEPLSLWFNIGWAGVIIPDDAEFTLRIKTDIGEYSKTFSPKPAHLIGGKLYIMEINDGRWRSGSSFAGGDGTKSNPYLISNYIHMKNMRSVITDEREVFFKMTRDVDMAPSYAGYWIPLNESPTYNKKIDFNGDGHVIRNLTIDGAFQHCGFFAILNGHVHEVTFENAAITDIYNPSGANHDVGVVCGYAGYVNNGIVIGNFDFFYCAMKIKSF